MVESKRDVSEGKRAKSFWHFENIVVYEFLGDFGEFWHFQPILT
jgi:hypothetical protein